MGYNNIFSNENNQANNAYHKSFQPICDGFFTLVHSASWILHARRRPARISKLMHQKISDAFFRVRGIHPSVTSNPASYPLFLHPFSCWKFPCYHSWKFSCYHEFVFTQTWNSTSAMTHEQVCKWANPCDGSSNTRMYLFPDCCARCRWSQVGVSSVYTVYQGRATGQPKLVYYLHYATS